MKTRRHAGAAARGGMLVLLAGLALVAGWNAVALAKDWDSYTSGEPFSWKGKVAAGKTVRVVGINGPIRAEKATGSEVTVDAKRRARKGDPDRIKIEVSQGADGVTICARYPARGGGLTDCDGEQNIERNYEASVDFLVRVPAGVNLDLATVNGEVEADDVTGDIEAATVNGSIHLSTEGAARATTVNGSIRASIGKVSSDLDFTTVNGGIRIELPSTAGARIAARTVNGDIESDFPMMIKGRVTPNSLNGTIGKGGPRMQLETVNGSIELRSI